MDSNDSLRSGDARDGFALSCLAKPKNSVKMVSGREDFFYKLNHKNRGIAVIFNHENFFMPRLKPRSGTNEDEANLKRTLEKLSFQVLSFTDLTTAELFDEVDKLAKMDHTDNDCFVMCILTHGDDGCLYSKNSSYKHDDIFCRFTADQCKTLAGKPKLFFLQACQGDRLDPGVTVTQTDSASSYRIPVYADFLIAYSTMPDDASESPPRQLSNRNIDNEDKSHYSWRNTTRGSWFIQSLCSVLREYAYDYDLLNLMTLVNRRVAIDFESNVPGDRLMHAQKQIPCITFMLTRVFHLSPVRNVAPGTSN